MSKTKKELQAVIDSIRDELTQLQSDKEILLRHADVRQNVNFELMREVNELKEVLQSIVELDEEPYSKHLATNALNK
jgi:hypothetical protein